MRLKEVLYVFEVGHICIYIYKRKGSKIFIKFHMEEVSPL